MKLNEYNKNDTSKMKIVKSINTHNNTLYSAIICTRKEAQINDNDSKVVNANSRHGEYAKKFRKGCRDNFNLAQNVRIAKKDNIKDKGLKDKKGRYLETGKVVAILPGDSYLIKRRNGKF